MAGNEKKQSKSTKPGSGGLGLLGLIYVVGFLATTGYYVISGFTGCKARTLAGRCLDLELMIEALVFSLIWPLHWLLEIIEAVAG
ncbi:MAG: hypothetical protein ACTSUD_11650 [Alphaproteobacteria bacterium]